MFCKLVTEKCIACGLCQVIAPDVFDYTDEGIVIFSENSVKNEMLVPKDLEPQCLEAYKQCPTRAIELIK